MAIKVSGTEVISDSRALNNIASIDATTAASINAAGVGGGATHQATASGALANGDLVIVNSDGTVSVVEAEVSVTSGTPEVFRGSEVIFLSSAYDAQNDKFVVVYRDDNNSSYGTAVVGTVSGTSISFGTPVVYYSARSNYNSATFDSVNNKIIVFFQDASGSVRGIVGTVSGTSISFGSNAQMTGANTYYTACDFDTASGKAVVVFRNLDSNDEGNAVVATVSGTSISAGSPVTFSSGIMDYPAVSYDSNANKTVISYRDAGNSNYGTARVGTVSGTSISFGSAVTFHAVECRYVASTFDSDNNKVVIAYGNNSNSGYATAVVGTVSGTSISFGTPVVYNSVAADNATISAVYDTKGKKPVLSNKNIAAVGTVSGTAISFSSPHTFETGNATYLTSCFDSTSGQVINSYQDTSNSRSGTSVTINVKTTNLTSTNYIGISDGAYSDAATATVQVAGAVDDAQSGLTAGQAYYVQVDGTLDTTPDDLSVFAGTAVSATEIIVKG